MKPIPEVTEDCVKQVLSIIRCGHIETGSITTVRPDELLAIAPIIAAMITATIDREKIALQEKMFLAEYGGYNGG